MVQRFKACGVGILAASLAAPAAAQSKIGTKFADVIMEYVTPGKVYNLRTMRNLPYRVQNDSAGPVDLDITVEVPQKDSLKEDYEPIADPSWIRIVPSRMQLKAGEQGLADIILQVPDDPVYAKRHYQAHILCASAPPPAGQASGLAFTLAIASRLRFSVDSAGPESIRRIQKAGLYQQLNFTLEPEILNVPGFQPLGKRLDLSETGARLALVNRGIQKLNFILKVVAPPEGIVLAPGYELAPDFSWLTLKPKMLKVPSDSIKSANLILEIPDKPEHRGKRYVFVVQATLKEKEIPVEVYSRVYVNTAK